MAPTTTTTTKSSHKSSHKSDLHLSANFANPSSSKSKPKSFLPSTIDYDHEVFLQLTAGAGESVKTANQERARRRKSRALDPAISDPQGEPGAIDFEWAEYQGKERVR
ncbi:uncharacterized protein ATNIH1004_002571 [Aspergillus tanneri]|uniref:Uncharacterized protein n=1 Tax=Aspergillus tanneri TaxID=1220188 RepID=A0A5M9MS17_9EURO|nr:uncharacterized protein ATNIH1004_002571 [Aspergillus tanneri]KAA8649892.1 hypothetical protein ATNIH1004_002571 [Aspergillus tanneri]